MGIRLVISGLLAVVWLPAATFALYGSSSPVVQLSTANFKNRVLSSGELWIVEFFAPWCGHCKNFAPEFEKAARALKGVVNVGAVDADQDKSLGGQYGVRGFPTVKIFLPGSSSPIDYSGPRTADGLVTAAFKELRKVVDERMGRKSSDGGSGGSGSKKDVIELTEDNFDKLVLKSEDMWLVEFFAPWCGHCKNLEPHWAKAATELKGKVKVGAVDATVHQALASRYGVKGYPTIKYFPAGAKSDAEEYNGGRTADDIVNWALEKVAEAAPAPELKQITSEKVLTESCENAQLCIISFLPHILDCQSECRNKYLDDLRKLGEKYKRQRWEWLWAEAMQQPQLEDTLEVGGFGYPALAAINARKMKYSLLRGSFGYEGINEFLRELSFGRGSSAPVRGAKLPKIVDVEAWDGKDAPPPAEDDVDLSDVELDDLGGAKEKTEL